MSLLDKLKARAAANIKPEQLATALVERLGNSPKVIGSSETSASSSPSLISKLTQRAAETQPIVYAEVSRICALAVAQTLKKGTKEFEAFCRTHILASAFDAGWRFFEPQANAILAFEQSLGLFCPIGVGWGKTLITLACASIAFRERRAHKILLVVPSAVYPQLMQRDISWARTKIPLTMPIFGIGGKSADARKMIVSGHRRGLYVMPYSYLSTKDSVDLLKQIDAGLLLLDEAHNVKSRKAARTRRLLDWIAERKPEVVALSGTMTSKSIMDYHHLIRTCLRAGTPLPLSAQLAGEWSSVIDSGAPAAQVLTGNPILPLVEWARKTCPDLEELRRADVTGFRAAYRLRLVTAPGVVATGDNEIGTSLMLDNVPSQLPKAAGAQVLKKLVDDVEKLWVTPNGDEIEFAIHAYKWLYELHSGFYNELVWPSLEELAKRRQIEPGAAEGLLERAKHHHAAGQRYAKRLREFLEHESFPGCDTPLLAGATMERSGGATVPADLFERWRDWRALRFDGMPERDSRAVRVADHKITAAVRFAKEWAEEGSGGLLWVYHHEMGAWLREALLQAGIEPLYCPAGDAANQAIIDPENKNRIAVVSMSAHGTGKNLQHFQRQAFVQWPRSAVLAEQTLGRTHRNGQLADELVVNTMLESQFESLLFAATLNDAVYIHQSTGVRQKIVYCEYSTLPKIYSHEFLRARGFEPRALDETQQKELHERFGQEAV